MTYDVAINTYASFIIDIVVIVATVAFAYSLASEPNNDLKDTRRVTAALVLIELVFAALLMMSDKDLAVYSPLHWGILLSYFLLTGVFGSLSVSKTNRKYALVLALLSVFMISAIIADASFNLPFSLLSENGWSYLFGFGTTATSSLSRSLYVTGILAFAVADLAASIALLLRGKPSKR